MSFYLMHRGWMDAPIFKDEPFTGREAFMWMVENAVWEQEGRKKRLINSYEIVTIKRGQLCYSLRFLAKKWQWSLGKVQRYTTRLKIDTLIDTAIDTGEMIITICNYDKYQKFSTERDTANDTANDTATRQQPIQRRKNIKELKEDKERKESIYAHFPDFWEAYPRKLDKKKSEEIFNRITKAGENPEAIIAGAKAYRLSCAGSEQKFIKHPTTWLNGRCWENTYAAEKSRTEAEIQAEWRERNRMKSPAGG